MSDSAISIRKPLIKTVLFTVATSLVLGLVALQLGGPSLQSSEDYGAEFRDASGLKTRDPVMISGVEVGKVSSVENLDNGLAQVNFTLRNGRTVPRNANAVARYRNLTGDRYLELDPADAPDRALAPDEVIPAAHTRPALDLDALLAGLNPLFEGLEPNQVNDLSANLVQVLQGEGGNIESILHRISSFSSGLADKDAVIGQVVQNLNSVLGSLDGHKSELTSTITGLQQLVSGLSDQRGRLGQSFGRADQLVGSLNGLVTNLRGPFDGFVHELGRTGAQLNAGKGTVNDVLRTLPGAYLRIGRLGSRGAGYNLFLCGVRVRFSGPGAKPIYTPWIGPSPNVQRCKPGIDPLETPEQRVHNEQAGLPVGTR